MIQRNDKGKQARQYFLQLEKDWNSPEKVMAQALRIADMKISALTESARTLAAQIERDAPKVLFADAVSVSDSAILIGELAKLLKQNGVADMGQNRLFAWLRANEYLIRLNHTRQVGWQVADLEKWVAAYEAGDVEFTSPTAFPYTQNDCPCAKTA